MVVLLGLFLVEVIISYYFTLFLVLYTYFFNYLGILRVLIIKSYQNVIIRVSNAVSEKFDKIFI